jgi:transcriptional regulator with XRE-family HTH domain
MLVSPASILSIAVCAFLSPDSARFRTARPRSAVKLLSPTIAAALSRVFPGGVEFFTAFRTLLVGVSPADVLVSFCLSAASFASISFSRLYSRRRWTFVFSRWRLANSGITTPMIIGERIKAIRESKKLSQGDVEKLTGLIRCYTSRVENGHTVPNVETLEKYARAFGIPVYRLFYDGEIDSSLKLPVSRTGDPSRGSNGRDRKALRQFSKLLSRMSEQDRKLLLALATKMAAGSRRSLRTNQSS